MTKLHYSKSKLALLLAGAIAMTAGLGWFAVAHPEPSHGGRYAALYEWLGPTGTGVFFGLATLFFAACCVAMAATLSGPAVAAQINSDGIVIRQSWGDLKLPWRELRSFSTRTMRVRDREQRWLVVHFRPRRIGPFVRKKTHLSHDILTCDERAIEAWVDKALATAALALAPAPPAPSAQGFGRRGLTRHPTSA